MRIGLALSGGAARGIAHIGVLQYLEERGVKPCCVAGTSAGSIVGALYCSGKNIDEIKSIIEKMSWKDLVRLNVPRTGLIKSSRLLQIIRDQIGELTFEELKIPLLINAVDLLSGEEIVFDEGPVAEAVQASCAVPGIFTPVCWEEHLLVDGGLLDNVPVALMKGCNIDYIIAVDVGAQKPLKNEPDNIFEVLIQSFHILRRQRDMSAYKYADILIEPDLGSFSFWDISKLDLLTRRGYDEAKKVLADVNLKKKKWHLFKSHKKKNKQR